MKLDERFIPIRNAFYETVADFFTSLAKLFGYPENPGIPIISDLPGDTRSKFFDSLPIREMSWPPQERAENLFEVIFGAVPKIDLVTRYIYENTEEGFYNFYIRNYQNIYFLPDWLSEYIQVNLNICLDLTVLEIIREFLFVGFGVYSQLIGFRLVLSWFLSINPFNPPWCYLLAIVDWTDELLLGLFPSILGINMTSNFFLGLLGAMTDGLNNLVFTMPFLPSEGEESKLLINGKMEDVIIFHYLPVLWYRYPIPNEIRQFWYDRRPDILEYMQKAYENLDIQFLPNEMLTNHTILSKIHLPLSDIIQINMFLNPN